MFLLGIDFQPLSSDKRKTLEVLQQLRLAGRSVFLIVNHRAVGRPTGVHCMPKERPSNVRLLKEVAGSPPWTIR